MSKGVFALVVMVLLCANGEVDGRLTVSPVMIEDSMAQVGNTYKVQLANSSSEQFTVKFRLATFDQNGAGQVVFQCDQASYYNIEDILSLDSEETTLDANQSLPIYLTLLDDSFDALYPILLIEVLGKQVSTQVGVALLLSTVKEPPEIALGCSAWDGELFTVELENIGSRHGSFQGTAAFFDSQGVRLGHTPVKSGRVLPGRSRDLEIPIVPGTERIDLFDGAHTYTFVDGTEQ